MIIETQISPILELPVVLLVEAVWATIVVAVVIGGTQIYQFVKQRGERQRQVTIDSARLVMEIDKVYRTDEFRKVQKWMYYGTINLNDVEQKEWFIRYINHSQFVCKSFAEGLISKSDMRVSYSGLEVLLNKNDNTREYIEKMKETYPYLHWYFRYVRAQNRHR